MPKMPTTKSAKITVSDLNLRNAASRLLKTSLVSAEIVYIKKELGKSATQEALDAKVVEVRKLPWSTIASAE